jgi:hypothetical protein
VPTCGDKMAKWSTLGLQARWMQCHVECASEPSVLSLAHTLWIISVHILSLAQNIRTDIIHSGCDDSIIKYVQYHIILYSIMNYCTDMMCTAL